MKKQELRQYHYSSQFFECSTLDEAKQRILIPIAGADTDKRWEAETQFLLNIIDKCWSITPNTIILDYGCGVGRMAKALIEKYNCYVIGVDNVVNMRTFASHYVSSDRFFSCPVEMLNKLGVQFDYALAIWVFLHCCDLIQDIGNVKTHLKKDGQLLVVNEEQRVIPTTENVMVDDGLKIKDELAKKFKLIEMNSLNYVEANKQFQEVTFWGIYLND